MLHPVPHLALAAAVGIAALASSGCPPPLADLGDYTTRTTSDPDSGEGESSATAATSTVTDDPGDTTRATTSTGATTGDPTLAATTDASTTAVSATDGTETGTIETSDTHSDTTGASECLPVDPLHPFPAPYLSLGDNEAHGSCTLTDVGPLPGEPDKMHINLFCRGEPINIMIIDGPLPEMIALKSQQIDVDINIEASELGPERHWVVLSRDDRLIYASVRGHTLLGAGVEGDAYAPFAFDTDPGVCDLAPTTPSWPPADPDGFACELAAPIFLKVRVNNQEPAVLLKAGFTLEAPVVGGKYRLEVRAVTRGHNCTPGFPANTDVDTYSFAVASQPD